MLVQNWLCGLLACVVFSLAAADKTEENCEVCVKFTRRFMENLNKDEQFNQDKIEKRLLKECAKKVGKDERFCYALGAKETSATKMLNEFTRPVSLGMEAEKVCTKIFKKISQICDLRYDKTYDFATVNFKKLKVKELKKILSDWNANCRGCTEKTDYINKILELLPEHDPEAYAKRMKSEL